MLSATSTIHIHPFFSVLINKWHRKSSANATFLISLYLPIENATIFEHHTVVGHRNYSNYYKLNRFQTQTQDSTQNKINRQKSIEYNRAEILFGSLSLSVLLLWPKAARSIRSQIARLQEAAEWPRAPSRTIRIIVGMCVEWKMCVCVRIFRFSCRWSIL